MPVSHKAHRDWTPQRLLDWGERIGPRTRQIVEHQLTHKPHPEMGYRSCLGLLSLARQYSNERLEAAAHRAVQLRALNSRTVRNLLKQGLDQQPLPKATAAAQPACHENVRVPTITPKRSCSMMTQHTLNQLHQLRLSGMATALEEQWTLPACQSLTSMIGSACCLTANWHGVTTNAWNDCVNKPSSNTAVPAWKTSPPPRQRPGRAPDSHLGQRRLDPPTAQPVADRPTGVGKTWLACALGNQACRQGYSTLYLRTPRLLEQLRIAHGDGSFGRTLQQLAKVDVLILTTGSDTAEENARHDLLEVIDDRAAPGRRY